MTCYWVAFVIFPCRCRRSSAGQSDCRLILSIFTEGSILITNFFVRKSSYVTVKNCNILLLRSMSSQSLYFKKNISFELFSIIVWNIWFNFRIWSTKNHRRVLVHFFLKKKQKQSVSELSVRSLHPSNVLYFVRVRVRQTSFGSSSYRNFGSFHWQRSDVNSCHQSLRILSVTLSSEQLSFK